MLRYRNTGSCGKVKGNVTLELSPLENQGTTSPLKVQDTAVSFPLPTLIAVAQTASPRCTEVLVPDSNIFFTTLPNYHHPKGLRMHISDPPQFHTVPDS